jgi:hypothetical protein
MKKAIFIILITLSFMGCGEFLQDCKCGFIDSDRASDYSVVILNDCTNNAKRWYLSEGSWMNAHVGTNHCITNSTGW